MGEEVLAFACVLILAVGSLFRLRRLAASPRDNAERAHVAVYVFALGGALCQIPAAYAAIDAATGVPNIALLVCAELTLISGWFAHIFYLVLRARIATHIPYMPVRIGLLLAIGALQALLFLLIDARDEVSSIGAFKARYGDSPYVLMLSIVVYAWTGWVFWTIAQITHYHADLSRRPMSRLGFNTSACGALFGIAYALVNEVVLAVRHLKLPHPSDIEVLDHGLVAGALLLLLAGQTMPLWGHRVGLPQLLRWMANYRAYLALFSLWRDLCRACPDVALVPPAADAINDLLPRSDLGFATYRRLVEILDARLELRPYMNPALVALAVQDSGERNAPSDHVLEEAATLDFALRAHALNLAPATNGALGDVPELGNLEAELSFFSRVSITRARSPLVRSIVKTLLTAPDGQAVQRAGVSRRQHATR